MATPNKISAAPPPANNKRPHPSNSTNFGGVVPNGGHKNQRVYVQPSGRRAQLKKERESLPIFPARQVLLDEIKANKCLVIVGETGSGKTTQLAQYLHEAGYTQKGMVAVTQPRRVAAITVAQRVADEMGVKLGQEVGYTIRFDDCSSHRTKLRYMTDGMLLRETILDPQLSKYSVIVLDEAHERTLHTDILFALVKDIQKRRPDLKVIAMSATLDAETFSKYFDGAKILYVAGRQFPVDIYYSDEPQPDYLDAAMITVFQIHVAKAKELPGDILVFLTGQEEIETTNRLLEERAKKLPEDLPKLQVVPIYAALPSHEQLKAFAPAPPGTRKVILATNIAETSITIEGIRFVIDTGVAKVRQFHPRTGMDCLAVVEVSKAEASQRTGRAGRQTSGECYRLYTEETFEKLRASIVPEILRSNLSSVVLQLKALKVNDILSFDFMDKPPKRSLARALEQLFVLGGLTDSGALSPLGEQMAVFPLDPLYSRTLIAATEHECSEEILSIMSMLSVESVFFNPRDKRDKALSAKRKFSSADGDHLTLLNVFNGFQEAKGDYNWCIENYINVKSMKKVMDVRKQLTQMFTRMGFEIKSCGANFESVRRCLVSGFFLHAARLQPDGTYKTMADSQVVNIHPSSVLSGKRPLPECVVYTELILTAKQYMHQLSVIDLAWLPELAPRFYATSSSGLGGPSGAAEASNKAHLSAHTLARLSQTPAARKAI